MIPQQLAPEVRERPSYTEGRDAYHSGLKDKDNPYPMGFGTDRTAWYAGFYDERTKERVGPILAQYGLSFP